MPALTPAQLDHYQENGYVLVENLLNPTTDLDPVLREYDQVLEDLAQELFAQNRLASTYADLDFDTRLCHIYNETGQVHARHFDISLQQGGITAETPIAVGTAAFAALLMARMRYMQVDQADQFRLLADENRINIRLIPPKRGEIYDRNGVIIARNSQSYRIVIVREDAGDVRWIKTQLDASLRR